MMWKMTYVDISLEGSLLAVPLTSPCAADTVIGCDCAGPMYLPSFCSASDFGEELNATTSVRITSTLEYRPLHVP